MLRVAQRERGCRRGECQPDTVMKVGGLAGIRQVGNG